MFEQLGKHPVFAVCIVVMILGCGEDNSTGPQLSPNSVIIRDNLFDPPVITVVLGRTVVWRHQGSTSHTVTSGTPTSNPGTIFDSGILTAGEGFQFTPTNTGTYSYFCRVHGTAMTGTINVR